MAQLPHLSDGEILRRVFYTASGPMGFCTVTLTAKLLDDPPLSFAFPSLSCFLSLLPEFPKITFQITYLHCNPCFRLCFWEIQRKTTQLQFPSNSKPPRSIPFPAGRRPWDLLPLCNLPALGSQYHGLCPDILDPTHKAYIQTLLELAYIFSFMTGSTETYTGQN